MTIGDIDGDGKLDLASANSTSNTVSVLRNTSTIGTISFSSKVDRPTGSQPRSVSVGDLDGDGKLDLAIANTTSNTISVLRNTSTIGTSTFATKVDFAIGTGTGPLTVSLGDIDGDGKLDLTVANFSNTVSVLRNTSTSGTITSGSFAARVTVATGNGLSNVTIGDIDGDGKLDLTLVNATSNTISVLRNTSTSGTITTGSFASNINFATENQPNSVSIGDLDGDGKLDIAVTNVGSNTVSVYRNTSTIGTISWGSFAPKVDFVTGTNPKSISLADIDGDGKLDLTLLNSTSNTVSVLKNVGQSLPPTITSFTPTSGKTGSIVNITGTNFGGTTNVKFGGTDAISFTVVSSTSIDATFGNGTTGTISVTNPAGTAISTGIFTYTHLTINLSPTSGAIGSSVIITGINFDTTTLANNIVWFGGVRAIVTNATITTLTVTVPVGATHTPIRVLVNGKIAESTKAFIVTYNGGFIDTSTFATKVDFITGTSPRNVSIGDIDGDGKLDLVVANNSSSSVSVYRNTSITGTISGGSFVPKVDFTTGSGTSPSSMSLGDIDGDGKLDIVVVNSNSYTFSVYRNTSTSGTINFASKVDFIPGFSLEPFISISIGDIDGDGKLDLAIPNNLQFKVSVLKNTSTIGNISFATRVDFVAEYGPIAASLGDIDGDGKLDLALANSNSNTVSVYRNTSISGTISSGSFATKVDFATGTEPRSMSLGDIDGDGKLDLVTANKNSNTISLLRNTSTNGTITSGSFASKLDFATGTQPRDLSFGDLDGDGKLDLAVANSANTTVSIYKNSSFNGTISFEAKVDFTTGISPISLSIGDIDGDGRLDLAIANAASNTVSILRNSQGLSPTITSISPTSGIIGTSVTISGSGFSSIAANNTVWFGGVKAIIISATRNTLTVTVPLGAIHDPIRVLVNGNGIAESPQAFIVTYSSGTIGTTSFASKVDFAVGTGPINLSTGDLDGDGKLDLVVGNTTSNTISVYRNTSTNGTISFATKVDFATGGTDPTGVSIVDIDGDGKLDLAVVNYTGAFSYSGVSIYRNTSNVGTISFATMVDCAAPGYDLSFGDLDGDGKLDLAVVNVLGGVRILRNTSKIGSISFATGVNFATEIQSTSLSIGDLDGDGKSDLATGGGIVLRNTSTYGTISFATKVYFGAFGYRLSIGDIDGDGKLDLATANFGSNTVSVVRNISNRDTLTSGSFETKVDFITGTNPYSISIGDLDGDGKLDLAIANYGSNTVSVLKNISNSGNITGESFATKVDFATGTSPRNVSIGDLDGDGKLDLAVVNISSNNVSIFRNVGQNLLPIITSFTPTNASSGATVTITGTNLTGATSVKFGGTNATSFTVLSDSSITVVVGIGTTGVITVTTPGGTASSLGIFTFNAAPILSPNLIYPLNSATSLPLNFMFRWDGVPTATNYNFKLSDVSNFSSLIKDTITIDSSYNMNGLNANTNYYWKVNAINNAGIGPFSPVWSFLTKSGTSINNIITDGYSIYQNHPNPFSSSTTIKFELQNELNVKIEIYNSFGQLVQTLLDNKMPAKIHEVIWDAEKFSTGLYFYKIVLTDIYNPNKEFVQTSKMMLMK
ncbi:MAG: FG-GAP-like repeat-containing protein [Bacteroidia bacterium]|nr:FG-GAP-like repeat-containing protein [Bacteroidia bacterium]